MAENTLEDNFLREGDISVQDNLEGMATGSKSSTVLSENAELMALDHFNERNDESHGRVAPRLRGNADPQTGRLCQTRSKDH